jgi:hypothetical protein
VPQKLQFHPFIYLTAEHLQTQTDENVYFFSMYRKDMAGAIAIFQCIDNQQNEWISPPRAPFGGIQCSADCEAEELLFFISCIADFVIKRQGARLTIKTAPSAYDYSLHQLLDHCFEKSGFSKIETHSNHLISVSSENFTEIIRPAERRRLQKCKLAGFTAKPDDQITLPDAYRFLLHCRNQCGYEVCLTYEQLNLLYTRFPGKIKLFSVFDAEKIIALTITIQVTDTVMYNFLMADLQEYRIFSPVVLLIETVYDYCQQAKITMLDLGISIDENGRHKPSLSRFKKNMGGNECEKITYQRTF